MITTASAALLRAAVIVAHALRGGSSFTLPSPGRRRVVLARGRAAATTPPPVLRSLPSLVVFDLDNTLWTPELYQLRELAGSNRHPVADRDVSLFPAAREVLRRIRSERTDGGRFADTQFAVASRTKSGAWARDLLDQFGLRDVFDYVEIFPGDKTRHFANLRAASGVEYSDMLFFDDARDGRYGNCEPVSRLGVLSVHCPNGLYDEAIWTNALDRYEDWAAHKHKSPGTIMEWDNSLTTLKAVDQDKREGTVKFVNRERRFGFIEYGGHGTRDVFFHFSALPNGAKVEEGDGLSFTVTTDTRSGKDAAANIEIQPNGSSDETALVNMKVFSMNLPFAALLSNGYKTLETRNGTMFAPYPEGTKMLLHVGQRTYPDGDRHVEVMKSGGLSDEEIRTLKTLPDGFGRGMAVAIVEIGKTYETTLEQRCDPYFQRAVAAFGEDSGMRATEIRRVEYLKRGVKVSGRGGVFKARVDRSVIPDGWLEDEEGGSVLPVTKKGKRVYYSATF